MFPFHRDYVNQSNKDLVFQISSSINNIPHQENHMITQQEDLQLFLMRGHQVLPAEGSSHRLSNNKVGKARKQHDVDDDMILANNPQNIGVRIHEANASHDRNKMMRRDNERQRRQQMALLNESLRSLLPPEFIKGKRSITEHMTEAVNYIKHMEGKIQELNGKREKLQIRSTTCSESLGSDLLNKCSILVLPTCWDGVEILISCSARCSSTSTSGEGTLPKPLSGVLKVLIEQGLSVVGCASTTVNQRLFHTIQCQLDEDSASVNLSEVQLKLNIYCSNSE